jgi:FAD dependent oxidoreductase
MTRGLLGVSLGLMMGLVGMMSWSILWRGLLVSISPLPPTHLTQTNFYLLGGGTILGGSYQIRNWESQPDPSLALRIMTRAVKVCPQLTGGKGVEGLSIIRHGVGLRPYRTGGVRLEKAKIEGRWVVHNYGHAGSGYQVSYACSSAVVKLVEEVLEVKAKI